MELKGRAKEKYISYKRDIAKLQHEHEKLSLEIRKHKKNRYPTDDLLIERGVILEKISFLKNCQVQLLGSIEAKKESRNYELYKSFYEVVEKTVSADVFNKILERAKKEIS